MILGLKFLSFIPNRSYQRRIYAFGNFICCPAVSYNLENLKNFKFNEEMKMVVDWDAWERIMKKEGKNQIYSGTFDGSPNSCRERDHSKYK